MPIRSRAAALAAALALASFSAPAARATNYPGFMPMITDSAAVFATPTVPEPEYLRWGRDPTFLTSITRIADDPGTDVGPLGPAWGTIARHVYSKLQPWNAIGTLLSLHNTGGAHGLSTVLLNAISYEPVLAQCPGYDHWDSRWHTLNAHANEQINVNEAGTELMWFDVVNCVKTRSWALPIVSDYGIGSGEGNVSVTSRFVAIANQHQMVVVDMDPQAPNAPPYPFQRIGPVYTFEACSLDVERPAAGVVSNVSISPLGNYIDVKYRQLSQPGGGECDTLCDVHRIFEVDSSLTIRPHNMADSSLRCGSFAARPNGWIFPLKHADMAIEPDGEEVIIGGRACPGATMGRVVKVRLRDGSVTPLTNPVNEAGYVHGSARNLERRGWFYVTYSRDPSYAGSRFQGEVVAVKTDGSGQVQRFAHYHSTQSIYESEAMGVPSPDGKRVLFASDWCDHGWGGPCSVSRVRAFVVDASMDARLGAPTPEPPRKLSLVSLHPNPTRGGLRVTFALPQRRPAALELFDIAGRRLDIRNVGLLGAGVHSLDLDEPRRLEPGVYFVTLTDGREKRSARAVVLR